MKQTIICILIFVAARLCAIDSLGYDLSRPDSSITLPDILFEISGLTVIDSSSIACVQDELGIIFIYDLADRKITREMYFHIEGDYEGIAVVKNIAFILRSDGTLFEIADYMKPGARIRSHYTGIPANNNEGLCYDNKNNRLLIASKSNIDKTKANREKRVIHGFDLKSRRLNTKPKFILELSAIERFMKIANVEVPGKVRKNGRIAASVKFRISAIAYHPLTDRLFILSAVDHLLLVIDRNGEIEYVEPLDPWLFNKAEGIGFFENGDMLISNEGQNRKPTLLRFNYRRR